MQNNHITIILGLPEFHVQPQVETEEYLYLRIEKSTKSEPCPSCGTHSFKIHDRRKQPVKDLPMRGKAVKLALVKRRFRCPQCDKVFAEQYTSLRRYQRMTNRLMLQIANHATTLTFKAAAANHNVSPYTARSLFLAQAQTIMVSKQAPAILAMDEFAVKKGKGENRYNLAIAVPTEKRLFDILPDRKQATVEAYLQGLQGKDNVKVVAIDMWRPYKWAIQKTLPEAVVVVDRFHVVRNVMWALDRVRRRIVEGNSELRKKLKRARYLLLKNNEDLDDRGQRRLRELLLCSEELATAYWCKEWFRIWYHDKNYSSAAEQLERWIQSAETSQIKELLYVAKTIHYWKQEILNYFIHPITTGFLEGTNNKIKTIKRQAYGFRTPGVLRAKALLSSGY